MRARRIREPFELAILDQGEQARENRWCIVAFDINGHQIPEIQGYDWREDKKTQESPIGRSIWLTRAVKEALQ